MPARYRIFTVPDPMPGTLTLQASAATWQELAARLRAGTSPAANVIAGQLADVPDDAPAVRITFPQDQARRILQLAGVSA